MAANKNTARIVGALFILATVAYMMGSKFIGSVIEAPNYLVNLYPNKTDVIFGVLLELINSAAVVGIAVLLYPILKKHHETIALGYVVSRVLESAMLIVSAISPLLLITLSQEYLKAGSPDTSYFHIIGTLAMRGHYLAFQMAMLVLGLGSLLFCYLLYLSRLVPRSISVLGLVGYAALLTSSLLDIFGYNPGMVLYLPGALFEIIFPIWLIIKGFNAQQLRRIV